MTDAKHSAARQIFERALELSLPARAAFLDGVCASDAALRAQVANLLAAHEEAGEFLSRPAQVAAASEQAGQMIGRYKLLQSIGEGGFGNVWMAEQREPVKRRVALKVIKLGMDTKQVIARFEAERQALALMDHPHIAKVLDAGATDTGRPYFVMELVRGVPIIEYCDNERLDTPARLDLFVGVCHAIQHAHQKGIIHRDIKPSNILVALQDGRPVPKVIDFGIAKAINAELTERTLFTEHRQMIGTPAYMSPEQAEMSSLDIDTRSDIYSLGVLLYELLTGTTPFDTRELLQQGLAEMLRVIREVEPHKPSTRISTLGATGSHTAERRHSNVRKLGLLLRGDLDWIVMRCLEKDRSRRYDTADGLALDVQRYLDGNAVLAAPPGRAYRARKFVVRNRRAVAAAALIGASLILGVVGTTMGLLHANQQRTLAETARNDERAQRKSADEARARAETINTFVRTALVSSDPNHGGKQEMLVADAMTQVLAGLDASAFVDDPETEAELRATAATILKGNGRAAEAEPQLVRALAIYRQLYPGDHPAVARTMGDLALARELLGRGAEAEPFLERALAMQQRLFQGDHSAVATGLNNLAFVRASLGRGAEAELLYVQALQMYQRLYEGDHPDIAKCLNNLASTMQSRGRAAEAESLFVQALAMNERLYESDHPEVAGSLGNLACVREALGRAAEAELLDVRALEMSQRLFKGDHPDVAGNLQNLASVRDSLGRAGEAEPLFAQALAMYQRLFRGDHASVALMLGKLAHARESLGRAAEAEPLYVQALDMHRRLVPGDHDATALALNDLARVRAALGGAVGAESLAVQALEMSERLYQGDHAFVAGALGGLAHVRLQLGRIAEAEPLFAQALEMYERLYPADHPDVASALIKLAYVRLELGRTVEAEALDARALEMRRRLLNGDHIDVVVALNNLGWARALLGHPDQAEPLYRESLAMRRRLLPRDDLGAAGTVSNLARSLADLGQRDEALSLAEDAAATAARAAPEGNPTRMKCDRHLAEIRALLATGH